MFGRGFRCGAFQAAVGVFYGHKDPTRAGAALGGWARGASCEDPVPWELCAEELWQPVASRMRFGFCEDKYVGVPCCHVSVDGFTIGDEATHVVSGDL